MTGLQPEEQSLKFPQNFSLQHTLLEAGKMKLAHVLTLPQASAHCLDSTLG